MSESEPLNATANAPVLGYISLSGDEVPEPTRENAHLLQQAADYRVNQKFLRRSGIGDIFWGALCVLLASASMRYSLINIVLLMIGAMLIGVGVWIAVRPSPMGMIFDGIALILVGLWNGWISYLILSRPGSNPNTMLPIMSIAQIGWGVYRLVRYGEFAAVAALRPSKQMVQWLDGTIKSVAKAKLNSDPTAIEFQIKGFNSYQRWKGRLLPDLAILVRDKGKDLRLLPRENVRIDVTGKKLLGKTRKAKFTLGRKTNKGTIAPTSLERYEQWSAAVPVAQAAPVQRQPVV